MTREGGGFAWSEAHNSNFAIDKLAVTQFTRRRRAAPGRPGHVAAREAPALILRGEPVKVSHSDVTVYHMIWATEWSHCVTLYGFSEFIEPVNNIGYTMVPVIICPLLPLIIGPLLLMIICQWLLINRYRWLLGHWCRWLFGHCCRWFGWTFWSKQGQKHVLWIGNEGDTTVQNLPMIICRWLFGHCCQWFGWTFWSKQG